MHIDPVLYFIFCFAIAFVLSAIIFFVLQIGFIDETKEKWIKSTLLQLGVSLMICSAVAIFDYFSGYDPEDGPDVFLIVMHQIFLGTVLGMSLFLNAIAGYFMMRKKRLNR